MIKKKVISNDFYVIDLFSEQSIEEKPIVEAQPELIISPISSEIVSVSNISGPEKKAAKKRQKSSKEIYCNWKNLCNENSLTYICCHYCPKKKECNLPCKCKDKLSECTYKRDIDKTLEILAERGKFLRK